MDSTGLTATTTELVGRERECALIDSLIENARSGESGTLVVRGQPGIGKTALLQHAADRAGGMTVLRSTGVEGESDLAFAGLYGLLRPVLTHLDELPTRQSEALAGALGLAPSAGADRFLVSAAVLALLAAAAEEQPVLCLVDDAQWLDRPSSDALVFAARRLRADAVAMVFAEREGEVPRFDASGLPDRIIGGLDERSAAAVIEAHAADAAPAVRARLLAEAEGNPLALIELSAALNDAQFAGVAPLPEAIPLTPRLHALYRERIARLPDATQTALLVAAAEDTGDLAVVTRAAVELEVAPDALDDAETADLVTIAGGMIRFRHPLVRSVVLADATASHQQRAHAALAKALSGAEHADRRVWHQAMATVTADEEVAAALEASARRAQVRAAHASAATAFLRAAELSSDEFRRVARIAAGAHAAWDAGEPNRARAAIEVVLPTAIGELRAQMLRLSGLIEARAGSLREAHRILLAAAEATEDPSFKLQVLCEAGEAASYAGDFAELGKLGERAALIPATGERDRFNLAVLAGFAALYAGDHAEASARFDEALGLADGLGDPAALIWAGNAASAAGGWGSGLPYASRAVQLARERGLLSILPRALETFGGELLWNSRFDLALAAAEEGYRLSDDMGFRSPWNLMTMASVEANRGLEDDARAHAEQVLAIGAETSGPFLLTSAHFTLAFLELVAGRWDQATDRLLAVTSSEGPMAHPITARAAVPDLVEAAVRAGRPEEAAGSLSAFRSWVTTTPSDVGKALLARCEGLLDLRPADQAFDEAIELEAALSPFQRARGRLLYGEWLRRERRRTDARVHLRAALDLFRQLGAVPWEERTAAELRATGESARKRDPSTLDELTPQELHIAGLVAEGLTNREIAAQLYLSPRTIDYHLRKVFSKLGIASRTQLVRQGLPERRAA